MQGKEKIIHILKDAMRRETEAFNHYHHSSLIAGSLETEALFIQLSEEERKHRIFILQELERIEMLMDKEFSESQIDDNEIRFILPQEISFKSLKTISQVDLAAISLPVEFLGGDYIDSFVVKKQKGPSSLGIFVYDVMGHGLNATRLKAETKKAMGNIRETWARGRRSNPIDLCRPRMVMKELNRLLIADCMMYRRFITIFYGIVDTVQNKLIYSSAGHEPPILVQTTGDYVHLDNTQLLIGAERNVSYTDVEVPLQPGAVLVLYSDGITEAANKKQEMFGRDRIKTVVQENSGKNVQEIIQSIVAALRNFLDGEPVMDDLILTVLKLKS